MFQGGSGTGVPVNVKLMSSVGDGVARAGAKMGAGVNALLDAGLRTGGYFAKEKVEEDELQDGRAMNVHETKLRAGYDELKAKWEMDDYVGGSQEMEADANSFFAGFERPSLRTERAAGDYDTFMEKMKIIGSSEARIIGRAVTARRYKESARAAIEDNARRGEYDAAISRISADAGVAWSDTEAEVLRGIVHDQQGWDVFNRVSKDDPWKGAALIGELAEQGNLSKKTLAKMSGYAEKNIKAAQSGLADALATKQLLGDDVVEEVKSALQLGRINPTKARVLLGSAARGAKGDGVHDGAVYSGLASAVGQLQDSGVESDPKGEKAAKIEFAINTAPISKGSKTYLLGELAAWRRGDVGVGGERESVARKLLDVQFDSGAFGTVKDGDTILPAGFVAATEKKIAVEKEARRLIRSQNAALDDVPKLIDTAIGNVDKGKNIFSPKEKTKDVIPPPSIKRDRIGVDGLQKRVDPKKNSVDKSPEKTDALGVDVSITKIDGESLEGFVERNWGAFGVETMEEAAMLRGDLINLYYAG